MKKILARPGRTRASSSLAARLLPLSACFLFACGFDAGATEELRCASRDEFEIVSPPLERRCGSTKCHGRQEEAYRVTSSSGLRLDPGDKPGAPPTTEAEIDAHYQSLCLLEPELMTSVVLGKAEPSELLLLKKGKEEEKHKGKDVIKDGDNLDRCLSSWFHGHADTMACQNAQFEL